MIRSLNATVKIGALLVLVVAGMVLSGPSGLGPAPQSAEAALLSEVKKLVASDPAPSDDFGWSVSVSGDTAIVGARLDTAGGTNAGAAYVFQRDQGGTGNWGEVKKLTAFDAQTDDRFGISVALAGNIAIVGARLEDAAGNNAGAAYVFQRDQGGAGNWGQVKKLTASDAQIADEFGWSVAVSGETAVVGANREDTGGSNAGAAYVFRRDEGGGDNWGQMKKLTASDAQADDNFGYSVAVTNDTAVVGAYAEDAGGLSIQGAGASYVFLRGEGGADNWGEVKKLIASDAQIADGFGWSVAVGGDTATVGAYAEDAGGAGAGAAYIFQRDLGGADNWGELKKLTASNAGADDRFGYSVAMSGDTAVVGAFREDTEGSDAGTAYVFQRDEGGANNWGEVTKLTASDAEADDFFGWSVAVSGATTIVGAYGEDTGSANAGAAYVFQEPLATPTATFTPTPTITPTPTPCIPPEKDFPSGCAVGGIVLDTDTGMRPLETPTSSRNGFGVLAWAIAAAAGVVTLGSTAWYTWRRSNRP